MLLAIDAGNTNIVFALFDQKELKHHWRISTDIRRTSDEYAVWLTQLMYLQQIKPEQVDGAIISCVVPEAQRTLQQLCKKYFEREAVIVEHNPEQLGIKALVPQPEYVGADRLVNAVAVKEYHGGPAIILDLGTATTFDVIDRDGNYTGGVIAPGPNLSLQALYMAAAKLPRITIERPEKAIGQSTIPAMQSGIFWGYVGLIQGITTQIRKELDNPDVKVIATGGLSSLFLGHSDVIQEIDPDLTLKGLNVIYQRVKGQGR